jgi:hypothetical protein
MIPGFFIGGIFGFVLFKLLSTWKAMCRVCCREHYATHDTCTCRDCEMDRS